jgi:hypothetical protein
MAVNRAAVVDQRFLQHVARLTPGPAQVNLDAAVAPGSRLTGRLALQLFESMIASRHLDLASRDLKSRDASFYTIGSAGHEGSAAVAASLRPTDMAFLHYRSGGFFVQRARQVPGQTPLLDVLLGVTAAKDEPIAGGRHKVFGSKSLYIPPQTSTIASHLPKAVGAAFTLERRKRLGLPWTCLKTASSSAPSATPPPTTPPPKARSTPRAGRRSRTCPCRSCLCVKTTASASPSLRLRAGWRRTTSTARGCGILAAAAWISPRPTTPPRPPSAMCVSTAAQRFCTCGWCDCSATRARTWSRATAARRRSRRTRPWTPCAARRAS